jgi:hypothetical protein
MVRGQCIKRPARIVNKNVKSPLNLHRDDQSIVKNVIDNIGDINYCRPIE